VVDFISKRPLLAGEKGATMMRRYLKPTYFWFSAVLTGAALIGWACAGHAAEAKPAATLENLMKAFDGESNAHARYLAFAKKADEEGYGQVAGLFRAAATAEEIHFKNHAEVIKKLGGTAKADVKAAEVKTTKENVEAALKGESYERDTMYPEFIATAEKEGVKKAVETFTEAKGAEAAHAKLYQEVLANLDAWKGGKKDFFVCPECGNTVLALTFENCPICGNSKGKFLKIN
jgi:rubrerythrin